MFEMIFSEHLDPEHELLRAAHLIDWEALHEALSVYCSPRGRNGKPIRLMVGIHILKHRYDCSDERAVEMLHENAYWQCFCGFQTFQKGAILEATSLVKFRNRIGTEGMKRIEEVLLKAWGAMGLVKTRKITVDTTSQPKNIAYPTDADLLHRIREKIVRQVKRVRGEVTLRRPFRSWTRTSRKLLLSIKRFCRHNPEKRKETIQKLRKVVTHVVTQAARMVKTLYTRGRNDLGRSLNRLVSLGRRVIRQTTEVRHGKKPRRRVYALHELGVVAIKKGKIHPACEFGSLVSLAVNEDGLILSHGEYQRNVADVKTLGPLMQDIRNTMETTPREVAADRGFSQSLRKQERQRKRWGIGRMAIPRKGKTPHPDAHTSWFRKAMKRRVKIEPTIGHLKHDHRMSRCRYKGIQGDTANVVWATIAWNTKKMVFLHRMKEARHFP